MSVLRDKTSELLLLLGIRLAFDALEVLGLVADLAHQVMALYQAQSEFEEAFGTLRQPGDRWVFDTQRACSGVFAAQTQIITKKQQVPGIGPIKLGHLAFVVDDPKRYDGTAWYAGAILLLGEWDE